jgi:uncharacterized membrane protein
MAMDSPDDPLVTGASELREADVEAIIAAHMAPLLERISQLEQTVAALTGQRASATDAGARGVRPATAASPPTPPPPRPQAYPQARLAALEAADETPAPHETFEDRLGSQIFNRIAIVAILIGATLFLKLAVDKHWIGPLGRILVGLAAGAALIVWSERFRRREFLAFSYSLKAIGSGVLYLTLWASFHLYHLVPSAAAFGLMLLVTLWNAWMAWSQNSELLAAYALAGGFATPLLLSTGGNHQVFLFGYLLTIDLATLALVRLREARLKAGGVPNWERLLLGALPVTIVYFINWYSEFYSPGQLGSTSIFIGLFFVAFLSVPFHLPRATHDPEEPEVRWQTRAISDVLLPLLNAAFGALAFYSVLEDSARHAWLPWGALVLSALFLVLTRLPQTAAARAVHLSLAIVFLTIAIPLKATGRWITLSWFAEGVGLLWASARLESSAASPSESPAEIGTSIPTLLRRLAAVALTLGFFGATALPWWLDRTIQSAFFNQRFATALAGIAALGVSAWIAWRAAQSPDARQVTAGSSLFPAWPQLAAACTVALNLLALQAGIDEIVTFWNPGYAYATAPASALPTALSISGFLMLYGAALLAAGFWKRSAFLRWQGLTLLVIAIAKTFLYDVRSLNEGYRVVSFLGLGTLLMAVSFAYVRRTSKTSRP